MNPAISVVSLACFWVIFKRTMRARSRQNGDTKKSVATLLSMVGIWRLLTYRIVILDQCRDGLVLATTQRVLFVEPQAWSSHAMRVLHISLRLPMKEKISDPLWQWALTHAIDENGSRRILWIHMAAMAYETRNHPKQRFLLPFIFIVLVLVAVAAIQIALVRNIEYATHPRHWRLAVEAAGGTQPSLWTHMVFGAQLPKLREKLATRVQENILQERIAIGEQRIQESLHMPSQYFAERVLKAWRLHQLHEAYAPNHRAQAYAKNWGSPHVFDFLKQPLPAPASYSLLKITNEDLYFSIFQKHDVPEEIHALTFLGGKDHRFVRTEHSAFGSRHADDMRHAIRMLLGVPKDPWESYGNASTSPLRKNLVLLQQSLGNEAKAVPEDIAPLVRCLPQVIEALPAYEQAIANKGVALLDTHLCGVFGDLIATFSQTPVDNAKTQTERNSWETSIAPQLSSIVSGYPFISSIADSDPNALSQLFNNVSQWEKSHPKSSEKTMFRKRLNVLKNVFLTGGSLGIALTFRPVASPHYGEISLGDGNIMHTYRGGPERWMQWHWRAGSPAVIVVKGRNQHTKRMEGTGPWSFLRLVDRGHASAIDEGVRITWQDISIDFQLRMTSSAKHPWRSLFAQIKETQ